MQSLYIIYKSPPGRLRNIHVCIKKMFLRSTFAVCRLIILALESWWSARLFIIWYFLLYYVVDCGTFFNCE
jgi:hypothetical protein